MNLQINIQDTGSDIVDGQSVRRLHVQVVAATGVSSKIFLVRQHGDNTEFVTVCMVNDLSDFPEDAPLEDAADPLFRVDEFDFVTNLPAMITELKNNIDRRVKLLLNTLKLVETFTTSVTLNYSA